MFAQVICLIRNSLILKRVNKNEIFYKNKFEEFKIRYLFINDNLLFCNLTSLGVLFQIFLYCISQEELSYAVKHKRFPSNHQ